MKTLERQLNMSKEKNAHLYIPMKTCRFCNFKTEAALVMERHLESPHMVNYTYKCNFCDFETRGPQVRFEDEFCSKPNNSSLTLLYLDGFHLIWDFSSFSSASILFGK